MHSSAELKGEEMKCKPAEEVNNKMKHLEKVDLTGNSSGTDEGEEDAFFLPPSPSTCMKHSLPFCAVYEDVWDGDPGDSSDIENDFLGFNIIPHGKNECPQPCANGVHSEETEEEEEEEEEEEVEDESGNKMVNSQVRRSRSDRRRRNRELLGFFKRRRKRKLSAKDNKDVNHSSHKTDSEISMPNLDGTKVTKSNKRQVKALGSPPTLQPECPPKKKKREFEYSNFNRRGCGGWEESLRPRPAQVQHYQSMILMRNNNRNAGKEFSKSSLDKVLNTNSSPLSSRPKRRATIHASQLSSLSSSNYSSSSSSFKNNSRFQRKSSSDIKKTRQSAKQENNYENENSYNEDLELASSEEDNSQGTEEQSGKPLEDACVGQIVWAKLGSTRWWPAMVIWGADCGQPPARSGQTWVFWFGDHKISELPRDKLTEFVSEFPNKYTDLAGKMFRQGVAEAVKEVAVRAKPDMAEKDSSFLIKWGKSGFPTDSERQNPYDPDPNSPIPASIREKLNKIKTQYMEALQSLEEQNFLEPRFARSEQLGDPDSSLKKVKEGVIKIQDVCIACDSASVKIVAQHPLIEGGLCKLCKDDILETMFAYGDDGTNAYCVICGQAGELLICDINDCNKCYCTGCIEVLVAPGAHKKVLDTSPWECYLCAERDPEDFGLIHPKKDWQQNVMQLFQPENHVSLPPSLDDYQEKKPVRVLSLFDGIGTGKYVLDQLGIEVEIYFASEIDQDAINVGIVQHRNNVKHLGEIENITDAEIAKLCPIDLVIGGSPCNDLSLVNPARKGLYDPTGTGKLFFDFFRILKAVQLANKGRHVFWLYENVASMPQEYKQTISRFLQCEPAMIDSKYFSPQNRARYFWGNIPGMYTAKYLPSILRPLQPHRVQQNVTLESVLTPHLHRKAVVEKIRTVTTRSNSLKQGKKCLLPVTMNGEGDVLWVTELEEVFGFPRHYTDAGNIPLGRRQQLLGKAWSVPVIKHLFTPLKNFFKTVSATSSCSSQTSSDISAEISEASVTKSLEEVTNSPVENSSNS